MDAVSILATWAIGATVFFRAQWRSGFSNIMGGDGDARLIVYLLEHWFQVLHAQASWRNPAFYYPVKDLTGWSDGFVLYEVFYSPLRLVGCDPFLAAQITIVLLSIVGFVSFVCFVRLLFHAPKPIALLGGLTFTFANNLWLHVGWYQLLGVWLVPAVLLCGLLAYRTLPQHRAQSLALGAACGIFAALMFSTAYYVSWFSTLAVCIVVLLLLVGGRRHFASYLWINLLQSWRLILVGFGSFVLGLVPFLLVYLPAQSEIHHESYGQVLTIAPVSQDVVNIGVGNVAWGWLFHLLFPSVNFFGFKQSYAVTPLVMIVSVVGSGLMLWKSRRVVDKARRELIQLTASLAACAVVLSVLPLKTRFGSLWFFVWHIPGATSIRQIGRIDVVTGFVASLALVGVATYFYRFGEKDVRGLSLKVFVVVLLMGATFEQLNTTPESFIHRPAQLAFLHSFHSPPAACTSFYVVDSVDKSLSLVYYQVDAMLISQELLVPTINGYTGYSPEGWGLEKIFSPAYERAVTSWAEARGLQAGLCQLDLGTMRWQSASHARKLIGPGPVVQPAFSLHAWTVPAGAHTVVTYTTTPNGAIAPVFTAVSGRSVYSFAEIHYRTPQDWSDRPYIYLTYKGTASGKRYELTFEFGLGQRDDAAYTILDDSNTWKTVALSTAQPGIISPDWSDVSYVRLALSSKSETGTIVLGVPLPSLP